MTATTAAPLETLAQQIARQQAELETLRQEYEARQTRLTDLTRRKEELNAQLQQVEADIQATTQGGVPSRAAAPTNTSQARPAPRTPSTPSPARSAAPAPQPPSPRAQTLPALLVDIVRQADGPVTVRQLADEVVRRQFPTTSGNVARLVATRAKGLEKRGLLRRAPGQAGFLLATSAAGVNTAPGKPTPARQASAKNGTVAKAALSKTDGQAQRVSLRPLLAKLLAKSRQPLPARELAEQVLASGYKTKSKNFVHVLWVALGQMPNVENVPGQGYRLKKR